MTYSKLRISEVQAWALRGRWLLWKGDFSAPGQKDSDPAEDRQAAEAGAVLGRNARLLTSGPTVIRTHRFPGGRGPACSSGCTPGPPHPAGLADAHAASVSVSSGFPGMGSVLSQRGSFL